MQVEIEKLHSYRQSVKKIASFAKEHCEDVRGIIPNDFGRFYEAVCRLPYVEDSGDEVVARPRIVLEMDGADCKKKCVLIGAYCILHGIGVRYVVMSNRTNGSPHHIYTEIDTGGGNWIPADATYNDNKLGQRERETFREVHSYE